MITRRLVAAPQSDVLLYKGRVMINLLQIEKKGRDPVLSSEDADTSPDQRPVNEVGPVLHGAETPHYKLNVLWDHFGPQVKSRIVSDVLSIKKIADTNRIPFVVATDADMASVLSNLGVTVTDNFLGPHLTRVYLTDGDSVPFSLSERLKDIRTEIDYFSVNVQRLSPKDPNAGADSADPYTGIVYPKLWHRIPETLPIDRAPPRGTSEPMWSPYL